MNAKLAKFAETAGWLTALVIWLSFAFFQWERHGFWAIACTPLACLWTYRMIRSFRAPKPQID
ncbi:hypothetical protein [Sphingobium sp. WCS2017Hpa-17]|uniref:hypothetical protein n=1 Tax=Sphingobium sp. WCS2017Hpa-17 TaxID=3073638 RepID=UPI00288C296F|nr:hypothetical protein [Sphingobium sp. WCS2017Hpa-17]